MSNRSLGLDERLYNYMAEVSLRESDLLRRLREETLALPEASMQIAPEQGQFMALMAEILDARRVVEVGTFTGYSALSFAGAMPADGRVVCCDKSAEWTAIAQRYWQEAGLDHKMDLRLGPALDTLEAMLAAEEAGRYDIAFIDADKENYGAYYDLCLELLRPGGLVMIDNVLWNGSVANPEKTDADTEAIRALNQRLHDDRRISLSLVPIGDGLTLCRKR